MIPMTKDVRRNVWNDLTGTDTNVIRMIQRSTDDRVKPTDSKKQTLKPAHTS